MSYLTLLAGIFDPRATLEPHRARALVEAALAFQGSVRIEQWGPLTVGLAPGEGVPVPGGGGTVHCSFEGEPRLDGRWADEQTLAGAWQREGDGALNRLRGGFAAVLWDEERERGLVVRDQMGQRPLLWHGGRRLTFAGEFRPLLELITPRPAPDETAVACWLGSRVPSGDRTLFEGIRRLPGGHLLALESGTWRPRPYWQPRFAEPFEGDREELLAGMVARLEAATATTLDGTRSPAVLLSGGIDSTSVAAVAEPIAQQSGQSLRAYSAVFPDLPEADESPLIDELVDSLGLHSTSVAVRGGSLLTGLLDYARSWHMPDISANNFFWIDLLRLAGQDGVDVLLDGEGGDELFMVPHYLLADLLARGNAKEARELVERWPRIAEVSHGGRRVRMNLVRHYGIGGLMPHAVDRALWLTGRKEPPVPLTPRAERVARRAADPAAWKRNEGPRWWRYIAHYMTEGPDSFGAPEHALRIARRAGVVRRRPLLDLELTEHVLRLPPQLAFAPWFTKGHIRSAMRDRVPDSILLRRHKTVFSDVRTRALASDLEFARRLLGPGAEVRRYVPAAAIEATLAGVPRDATVDERSAWGFRLQHMAGTEFWLRIQADPESSDELTSGAGLEPVDYDVLVRQGSGGRP